MIKMANIAVIPARGGSKRIKRKNIRKFIDKPMLQYAIEVAQQSKLFEHIIVSSDDQEISEFARSIGVETPFIRPKGLSDDHTATVPVIKHSIEETEKLGWQYTYVCCLYPCAPFVEVSDLKSSLALLKTSHADYSFPIVEFTSPIQRALKTDKHGNIEPYFPEFELERTQDLPKSYHDAGQFYWGKKSSWQSNPRIHSKAVGLVVPSWRAVDFDTEDDWIRGEMLFKSTQQIKKS